MRKLGGAIGACILAAIAVDACVGDEPATNDNIGTDSGADGTSADGNSGDGATPNDGAPNGDAGADAGLGPASCIGLPSNCGQLANQNCCESLLVDGGTFIRDYDGVGDASVLYIDNTHSATVSPFRLDTFAVTVNRFRKFVDGYPGDKPATDGAGKNPHNSQDVGWSTSFNALMPSAAVDLVTALDGCTDHTWTDGADAGVEARPMNCATWYEAFAFCIWDGGRLATSAEYNYAASGGSEQRFFPWSNPPYSQAVDPTHAVYMDLIAAGPPIAGSTPLGNGKFGQSDLTSNMESWVVDTASAAEPGSLPATCNDCGPFDAGGSRVMRGGAYFESTIDVRSARSFIVAPTARLYAYGFRCARNP